jgi:NAD(P)-dependent dehydrogenase (short-subunit alcohol dehydrogenase family)
MQHPDQSFAFRPKAGEKFTVLLTGATDGVGRCVAERLGATGAQVLVHGRNEARAGQVLDAIRRAGGSGQFYRADFSVLDEVRALAAAVQRDHPRLDVLVNNAGIGFGAPGGTRELSGDGHELRFAVNYLAGFLLTRLLLPLLQASRPARIVNVASAGQETLDFADPMLARDYSGIRAYRRSKLAQVMFTFDLAEQLRAAGVTVNSLHPATFMDTAMVRSAGIAPASTVEEGAEAILRLVLDEHLAGTTGQYFDGLRPARAIAQAYDAAARERLSALSLKLTGA